MARPITEACVKPALRMAYITEFHAGIEQVIGLKNSVISVALNHHMKKPLGFITWMKTLITVGIAILKLFVLIVGQY